MKTGSKIFSSLLFVLQLLFLSHTSFAHETNSGLVETVVDLLVDNLSTLVLILFIVAIILFMSYLFSFIKLLVKMAILLLILSVLGAAYLILNPQGIAYTPYHIHADFKVYLNGAQYDFNESKYMSTNEIKLSDLVHLHDADGDLIHYHARNIPLSQFFSTLNMTFNKTCFILDNGSSYCNSEFSQLKFYVRHNPTGSWQSNSSFGDYIASDLDQILISYGPLDQLEVGREEKTVTDKSCIQSEKCPERGKPTDASCAGDVCSA